MLGKWLILAGLGLVVIGALLWLGSRFGIPFGKLPGDIHIEGQKVSFYMPIVTCLVISVVLTLLLNLIFWFAKR